MPTPAESRVLTRLRRDLVAALGKVDVVLPGSITQRMMRCGKQVCRCRAEPPQLHGPYWQWSRKVAGKTVSRRLTPEQAERYQGWIDNSHTLRELLGRLEALGVEAVEEELRG